MGRRRFWTAGALLGAAVALGLGMWLEARRAEGPDPLGRASKRNAGTDAPHAAVPLDAAEPAGPAEPEERPETGAPSGEAPGDGLAGERAGAPAGAASAPGELVVSGRVLDEAGRGVPGAAVELDLRSVPWTERPEGFEPRATSDPTGQYRLEGLVSLELALLVARHPAYALGWTAGVDVGPSSPGGPVDIVLRAGASVRGRVLDEDGRAVAGALVVAECVTCGICTVPPEPVVLRGLERARAETGEDGTFEIPRLAGRCYELAASAPGSLDSIPSPAASVQLPQDGGDTAPVELYLRGGRTLAGRVEDASGKGLAGATLTCGLAAAETGASGVFRLAGLVGPRVAVTVARAGFRTREMSFAVPAEDVTIALDGLATLAGRLQFEGLEPPPRAKVRALTSDGLEWGEDIRVEDGDRFELEVPAGSYVVQAEASGCGPSRSDEVRIGPGERREGIEITLRRGAVLSGRVVEAGTGRPVARARVRALPAANHRMKSPYADRTDASGRFRIEGLPPGRTELAVARARLRPDGESFLAEVPAGASTLAPGEEMQVELRLRAEDPSFEPAGARPLSGAEGGPVKRMSGRITAKAGGLRVGGAWVAAFDRWRHPEDLVPGSFRGRPWLAAEVREDGGFQLEFDAGRSSFVWLESAGGAGLHRLEAELPGGSGDREIDWMVAPGKIHGRAVEKGTQVPVPDIILDLFDADADRSTCASFHAALRGRACTDRAGRFAFEGVAPGRWRVRAATGDGEALVDLSDAEPERAVAVELEPGRDLALVVLDRGGYPIEGASALIRNEAGDLVRVPIEESDSDGVLRVFGLPPGKYDATVAHRRFAPVRIALEAGDENHLRRVAVLARGGGMRVHVTEDGRPVRGARVDVVDREGRSYFEDVPPWPCGWARDPFPRPRSGEDGSLWIPHLVPRTYRVSASRGTARAEAVEHTVMEGESGEVHLELLGS